MAKDQLKLEKGLVNIVANKSGYKEKNFLLGEHKVYS
jgi:hypothetical protein